MNLPRCSLATPNHHLDQRSCLISKFSSDLTPSRSGLINGKGWLFAMIAAVLFAGCSPSRTERPRKLDPSDTPTNADAAAEVRATSPPIPSTKPTIVPVAITGAVVLTIDGTRFSYSKKCTHCGHAIPGTTTMSIPGRGVVQSSRAMCDKCRRMFDIKIQGTELSGTKSTN